MADKLILDACAILAFLNDEDGADSVDTLLQGGENGTINLYMSNLNFLEVYYGLLRDEGFDTAAIADNTIRSLPITLIAEIDDDVIYKAAYFKTNHHMSLADSVLLGIATKYNATVVTADHHEFDSVDATGDISFLWIRD